MHSNVDHINFLKMNVSGSLNLFSSQILRMNWHTSITSCGTETVKVELYILLLLFFYFVVALGIFPREIRAAFPEEIQLRQSRATQL